METIFSRSRGSPKLKNYWIYNHLELFYTNNRSQTIKLRKIRHSCLPINLIIDSHRNSEKSALEYLRSLYQLYFYISRFPLIQILSNHTAHQYDSLITTKKSQRAFPKSRRLKLPCSASITLFSSFGG